MDGIKDSNNMRRRTGRAVRLLLMVGWQIARRRECRSGLGGVGVVVTKGKDSGGGPRKGEHVGEAGSCRIF